MQPSNTWTQAEDRELAKELRTALTEIALKHDRTHHDIVQRIQDMKIIFSNTN